MKTTNHKLCQYVIKKYVKENINWPKEIKIAQKLIKRFNNYKFWFNLNAFNINLPSLAWFLKKEGKAFLLKEYELYNLDFIKNNTILLKNKIGIDKNICKKPKTLIEFIRYGKKI